LFRPFLKGEINLTPLSGPACDLPGLLDRARWPQRLRLESTLHRGIVSLLREDEAGKGNRECGRAVVEEEVGYFYGAAFGFGYIRLDLGVHAVASADEHLFQAVFARYFQIDRDGRDKLDGVIHGIASRRDQVSMSMSISQLLHAGRLLPLIFHPVSEMSPDLNRMLPR
jgi:hypothetical protein